MSRLLVLSAFVVLTAARTAATQQAAAPAPKPDPLTIDAAADRLCAGEQVTLTAKRGKTAVDATWASAPALGGWFASDNGGSTVVFQAMDADGTVAVTGEVTITASAGGETASKKVQLGGACDAPFSGDMTRASLGFEQIGASGLVSDEKYAFDFFITRPMGVGSATDGNNRYLGTPLKWWGDVRIASYPQQITADAATFAAGFLTSAGQLKVNKLVQTAEFTTGLEYRIAGSSQPVHSFIESSLERVALMIFAGGGAVGPFAAPTDDPPVFLKPDPATPQGRQFAIDYPIDPRDSTTKYVAFRATAPDRFLWNVSGGLRLYTFYADKTTGKPLQTAPAMVSASYGRNDLIAPDHRRAWHVSAYYPFALGDRADPSTLIVYMFGDVWMAGGRAVFTATRYQLQAAVDAAGKAIPVTDSRVNILSVQDRPRDTYRLGLAVDLLKVWDRLTKTAPTTSTTAPKS